MKRAEKIRALLRSQWRRWVNKATDYLTGKTIVKRWGLASKKTVTPDEVLTLKDGQFQITTATRRTSAWPAKTYTVTRTFATRSEARAARTPNHYIIDRESGYVVR
jgi:hypothetical protein